MEFINLPIDDQTRIETLNKINFKNSISFENVDFSYLEKKLILQNINLEIKKNKIFGIMVPTGSGKSTILNLILGFYRPSKGNIFIDDIKLKNDEVNKCARKSFICATKVYLIDDTIQSNITLEDTNDKVNQELLNKSIELAELGGFINEQKNGINHVIGEDAEKISGGQKQRIGIARAIYKNTNTLVFDGLSIL